MAKRNKAKFATKSRKSALRVEALEQRQLLAVVTGGGTEVGSNIVHPNGNVYDQVAMTGASVTVTADAGQVTRVSFLDLQGDIVQAEFSGAGSLTISLDQTNVANKGQVDAANYNQPGVKYVQGLATFTIQGENSTTNFSAFSVGSGNAINQTLFSGGKTGGNHLADVARLLIVADPSFPGGSTMGGIRMGNAVFSDNSVSSVSRPPMSRRKARSSSVISMRPMPAFRRSSSALTRSSRRSLSRVATSCRPIIKPSSVTSAGSIR